jgi:hypothetical protein
MILPISASQVARIAGMSQKCLVYFCLFTIAILANMRWYLIVVLIYIFLMIGNIVHFFIHLLATCMTFFKKFLPRSFICFKSGYLFSCYWVVWVSYLFWKITIYHECGLWIFSPIPLAVFSLCWLFPVLCRSFSVWCYSIWLFSLLLPVILKKNRPDQCHGILHVFF